MSEAEDKQVIEKPKISRLAIWSFSLIIIFGLAVFFSFIFEPNILFIFVCLISVLLGIIFGVISILTIVESKGELKGMGFAVSGLTIHLILAAAIIYIIVGIIPLVKRFVTYDKLSCLGKSLKFYSQDNNGLYPTADKWCDLLKSEQQINDTLFICPSGNTKKGSCDYAINPNCEPNSLPDIVLLFESKGGWNQSGGAELLYTERNNKLGGCYVLFNDGQVEFVKKEDFGKLKWKDEKVSAQKQGNEEKGEKE